MKRSSDRDLSGVDHLLCFALYSAHNATHRLNKTILDSIELTYPRYLVLSVLWSQDERSMTEIGEALFLESNTLTPIIKALEASGFVRRSRSADDERRVIVSLTSKGESVKAQTFGVKAKIMEASKLTDDDFDDLLEKLKRYRDNIRDYERKYLSRS